MSEPRQSLAERVALDATWQAHPKVAAFKRALQKHAAERGLRFDKAGMDALAKFAAAWQAANGALPDSGIVTG